MQKHMLGARPSRRLIVVVATATLTVGIVSASTAATASDPDFLDETTLRLPAASELSVRAEAGDIDGDDDLDLVVVAGNHTATTGFDPDATDMQLLINDGSGRFSDETGARIPTGSSSNPAGTAARFGDVDGDGDLDMFVTHGATGGRINSNFAGFQNSLLLNDGTGVFTDVTADRLPPALDSSMDAAFSDVDGDDDLDLYVANTTASGTSARNSLLINDGSGVFENLSAARLPSEADISLAVEMADLDQDGDPDVVVGNASGQPTKVLINVGGGVFENTTSGAFPSSVSGAALAVGDLTGNGCPDILLSGTTSLPRLFGGACDGSFDDGPTSRLPGTSRGALGVTIADVDGDGDVDIFAAMPGAQQRLFLNDGSGVFADVTGSHLPALVGIVRYPTFVDVDGDGDPDVFVPMWWDGAESQDRLLINQANFVRNQPPVCAAAEPSIALLWPANMKFVAVDINGVADPDGDEIEIAVDSVHQDEPVARPRSKRRTPDARIDGSTVKLRAERLGKRNGRVYHVAFTATDTGNASCAGTVIVGVPKNRHTEPVDGGAIFDSTTR